MLGPHPIGNVELAETNIKRNNREDLLGSLLGEGEGDFVEGHGLAASGITQEDERIGAAQESSHEVADAADVLMGIRSVSHEGQFHIGDQRLERLAHGQRMVLGLHAAHVEEVAAAHQAKRRQRIVATLRFAGRSQSYDLTPQPDYARSLSATISALAAQRVSLRGKMTAGATPHAIELLAAKIVIVRHAQY